MKSAEYYAKIITPKGEGWGLYADLVSAIQSEARREAFKEAAKIAARGNVFKHPCPIKPEHKFCKHDTEEEIRLLLESIFLELSIKPVPEKAHQNVYPF